MHTRTVPSLCAALKLEPQGLCGGCAGAAQRLGTVPVCNGKHGHINTNFVGFMKRFVTIWQTLSSARQTELVCVMQTKFVKCMTKFACCNKLCHGVDKVCHVQTICHMCRMCRQTLSCCRQGLSYVDKSCHNADKPGHAAKISPKANP